MCIEGKRRLYEFATANNVAAKRLGKLIVATSPEELPTLKMIAARAIANDVDDLRFLSRKEVQVLEPELDCAGALLSPSTEIIDSHGYMQALQGFLTSNDGKVICNTTVEKVRVRESADFELSLRCVDGDINITARNLVVAAGLGMAVLASNLPGAASYRPPRTFFAKGHYYTLTGRTPFKHLIYPVPVEGGLGTHLTLDMGGRARFGPDVQWIDRIDYCFDDPWGTRRDQFERAVCRYWPGLPRGALMPGYTGIRPKVSGAGEPAGDFEIHGPREHGIRRMVTLYGVESPGLTSSLAIAEYVLELLG